MRSLERTLIKAARSGNCRRLGKLLEEGAAIHCADGDGNTPLLHAAWAGHEDAVRFLLDAGADSLARAHDDATALFAAVARRHPNIVSLLLEHGADPNVGRRGSNPRPGDTAGYSPLHCAISHEDVTTAGMLLDAGARIDCVHFGKDAMAAAQARGLDDLVATMRKRWPRR